jgi:hypothetical protein
MVGLAFALGLATATPAPAARDYTFAILHGDFASAREAMDARLGKGEQVSLPMGRERSGGVDNWLLILTPDKVAVTEGMGKLHSDASIAGVKVEGPGLAKPAVGLTDRSPGHFVRLKVDGKTYNLYFWPPTGPQCHEAQRFLSLNTYLQCSGDGVAMQEFVAGYVVEALRQRGAQVKK